MRTRSAPRTARPTRGSFCSRGTRERQVDPYKRVTIASELRCPASALAVRRHLPQWHWKLNGICESHQSRRADECDGIKSCEDVAITSRVLVFRHGGWKINCCKRRKVCKPEPSKCRTERLPRSVELSLRSTDEKLIEPLVPFEEADTKLSQNVG